jgi:hypothetical protein
VGPRPCGNWNIFSAGSGKWGPIAIQPKEIPNVTVAYADLRMIEDMKLVGLSPGTHPPTQSAAAHSIVLRGRRSGGRYRFGDTHSLRHGYATRLLEN